MVSRNPLVDHFSHSNRHKPSHGDITITRFRSENGTLSYIIQKMIRIIGELCFFSTIKLVVVFPGLSLDIFRESQEPETTGFEAE